MFHTTDTYVACRQLREKLAEKTAKAYEDVIVGMFHLRNPRGGEGRVGVFYALLMELHGLHPNLAMTILPFIPEYGSWDDMFTIAHHFPVFKYEVLRLAEIQLLQEEEKVARGEALTTFAKWVPDEKKALRAIAKEFAYYLVRSFSPMPQHSMIMASYRRRISKLNKIVNPVEIYECAGRWDEIDPEKVSAGALRVKHAAYLNEKPHTGEQRSSDERRIQCANRFKAFFASRPPATYEKIDASSDRYSAIRAVVSEWVEGGWRV
jgi:hypothetical protein